MTRSGGGEVYEGEWEDDLFSGYGVLKRRAKAWTEEGGAYGFTYSGLFHEGEFWGKGKITYEDGAEYEGEFRRGKKEGFGTLCFLASPGREDALMAGILGKREEKKQCKYVGQFRDD